jgi:hypothetical protein
MKTAREIAHKECFVRISRGCDYGDLSLDHSVECDDLTKAARATQLDTLRWVLSDSAISDVDIRTKIRELEAGK